MNSSRHCDIDSVHVMLKDMEPHMIYDSNMTATIAALKKLNQLEEEKFKLLKNNLILELEVRQLEVHREKLLRKSCRWEEKVKPLEEDNNELNEKEKVCEEKNQAAGGRFQCNDGENTNNGVQNLPAEGIKRCTASDGQQLGHLH